MPKFFRAKESFLFFTKPQSSKMRVALLNYGDFRSVRQVLQSNLQELQNLFPPDTLFDTYILSKKDEKTFYSPETEEWIRSLLSKHPFTLSSFVFWEDIGKQFEALETIMRELYDRVSATRKEVAGTNYSFVPCLVFRKYILYKLFESSQKIQYDYVCFFRFFDTELKCLRPLSLDSETLYFCIDHLFIASPPLMKILMMFGTQLSTSFSAIEDETLWSDLSLFDKNLSQVRPEFTAEVQLFHYIRKTFPRYANIRYDFTTDSSPSHITANLYCRVVRTHFIPKKILQIAIGDSYTASLPLDTLKQNLLHSNPGYSYELWTEADCLSFLQKTIPDLVETYHAIQRPQYKSDLIRYAWLFASGGTYIDIDILPTLPLDVLNDTKTEACKLFASLGAHCTDSVKEVPNGFVGSEPNNPLFLKLLDFMKANPNPTDYGQNVKFFYTTLQSHYNISMTPFHKERGVFLYEERQFAPGKYAFFYKDELIGVSNGCGYPFHLKLS